MLSDHLYLQYTILYTYIQFYSHYIYLSTLLSLINCAALQFITRLLENDFEDDAGALGAAGAAAGGQPPARRRRLNPPDPNGGGAIPATSTPSAISKHVKAHHIYHIRQTLLMLCNDIERRVDPSTNRGQSCFIIDEGDTTMKDEVDRSFSELKRILEFVKDDVRSVEFMPARAEATRLYDEFDSIVKGKRRATTRPFIF